MILKYQFLAVAFFAISVLGCSSDNCDCEPNSNPVSPQENETGSVILLTDWSKRSEAAQIPNLYAVYLDKQSLLFAQSENKLPDHSGGSYASIIYNMPQKIAISQTKASVETSNNVVESNPEYLFTAYAAINYEKGKTLIQTVKMTQQIRQLYIALNSTTDQIAYLASVTAQLNGIANVLDFKENTYLGNTNLKVIPVFSKYTDQLNSNVFLLGFTENQPIILTLDLVFIDGSTQTLTCDVSSHLSNFNANKMYPFSLIGTLVINKNNSGYNAEANNWKGTSSTSGSAWN